MKSGKDKIILICLVIFLFVINYNFIDDFLEKNLLENDFVEVERVIDGDTVVVNGTSVRLLGINTPEKGEEYFLEAKIFLEELVMDKSVRIERKGKDRYYRELAYLFDGSKNLNLEIVKEGLANYYFPSGKDRYYNDFVEAWNDCKKNLCEMSENICSSCLEIELDVKEDEIIIFNECGFDCDLDGWSVKDEGRKKFVFDKEIITSGEKIILNAGNFSKDYILTKSGDSIFVRDSEGKLVLFEGY